MVGRYRFSLIAILAGFSFLTACQPVPSASRGSYTLPSHPVLKPLAPNSPPQLKQLIEGVKEQVGVTTGYDPAYVGISYPGGDVAAETGVCSDVVVRGFRKAGIDLQREVHEDMASAWSEYPKKWGTAGPDTNIDHRRVLNLMKYFERRGKSLPITNGKDDYLPGDIVSWDLGNGVDHIGIVTDILSEDGKHCLIAHNIGAGVRLENVLFAWRITGHFRFFT